jgi:hypothetical protein
MHIKSEKIIEITSYFTIIHHIKGRLRVRVNPKIRELEDDVKMSDIEGLAHKIEGIKKIKINKVVASVTIEYDSEIFPMQLWEDLVAQRNIEELTQKINKLYKEVA